MDVEGTIEFLLQHQARMAAENELCHAHQAEVRADHEERFKELQASQLDLSDSLGQLSKRVDRLARLVSDSIENNESAIRASRESIEAQKVQHSELLESQKHTDDRINALIQVVDELIRRRPQQ